MPAPELLPAATYAHLAESALRDAVDAEQNHMPRGADTLRAEAHVFALLAVAAAVSASR